MVPKPAENSVQEIVMRLICYLQTAVETTSSSPSLPSNTVASVRETVPVLQVWRVWHTPELYAKWPPCTFWVSVAFQRQHRQYRCGQDQQVMQRIDVPRQIVKLCESVGARLTGRND